MWGVRGEDGGDSREEIEDGNNNKMVGVAAQSLADQNTNQHSCESQMKVSNLTEGKNSLLGSH